MNDFLTRAEAAKLLRVDVKTISRWTKSGKLAVVRFGRKLLIPRTEIEEKGAVK